MLLVGEGSFSQTCEFISDENLVENQESTCCHTCVLEVLSHSGKEIEHRADFEVRSR